MSVVPAHWQFNISWSTVTVSNSLIYEAVFSMSETWKISSIQLHLQQSYCTLKLLDFFPRCDLTSYLGLCTHLTITFLSSGLCLDSEGSFTPVLALYDPFGVDVPLNFDITHSVTHPPETTSHDFKNATPTVTILSSTVLYIFTVTVPTSFIAWNCEN